MLDTKVCYQGIAAAADEWQDEYTDGNITRQPIVQVQERIKPSQPLTVAKREKHGVYHESGSPAHGCLGTPMLHDLPLRSDAKIVEAGSMNLAKAP